MIKKFAMIGLIVLFAVCMGCTGADSVMKKPLVSDTKIITMDHYISRESIDDSFDIAVVRYNDSKVTCFILNKPGSYDTGISCVKD